MQQIKTIVRFTWERQKVAIRLGVVAFLLVLLAYSIRPIWNFIFQTQGVLAGSGALNGIAAAFSVATFVVAVLVWWGEAKEDWEESLPKRLTVVFLFENSPAMVCEDATLVAEGDIRAMAQQLGAQMVGERSLALGPYLNIDEPSLILADAGWIKRFEIHLPLSELPKLVANKRDESKQAGVVYVRRKVEGEWKDIWESHYKNIPAAQ